MTKKADIIFTALVIVTICTTAGLAIFYEVPEGWEYKTVSGTLDSVYYDDGSGIGESEKMVLYFKDAPNLIFYGNVLQHYLVVEDYEDKNVTVEYSIRTQGLKRKAFFNSIEER